MFIIEPLVGFIVLGFLVYRLVRAEKNIEQWVVESKIQLKEKKREYFYSGPFSFFGGGINYRLEITTRFGEDRVCWIRCNGFSGFNINSLEVKWGDGLFPMYFRDEPTPQI